MTEAALPLGRFGIVALWSAPRCRSTAFLRMMVERGDFTVLHEPCSQLKNFGCAYVADRWEARPTIVRATSAPQVTPSLPGALPCPPEIPPSGDGPPVGT